MVYVGSIVRNRPKKRPKMTGTRRRLFEEHKTLCAYCRRPTKMPSLLPGTHHELTATVEHVIPISRGGSMKGDNLTLACALCNTLKADMTPHQWAEFMMINPQWWLRSKRNKAKPTRAQVLPIAETQMILQEGKKAWREWKAGPKNLSVCPVMVIVAEFFVRQRYGIWRPLPGAGQASR